MKSRVINDNDRSIPSAMTNMLFLRNEQEVHHGRHGWQILFVALLLVGMMLPCHAMPPMSSSAYKKWAQEMVQAEANPEDIAEVYMWWGERAFAEDSANPEAITAYQQLVEKFPKSKFRDDALLHLAIIHHYYYHDYEKALGYYRKILTEDEFEVEGPLYRMSEYAEWSKTDVQSAVQHLQDVVETLAAKLEALRNAAKPTDKANAYWDLVDLHKKEKNYSESLRLLTVLSEDANRETSARAFHEMARIYVVDVPRFIKAPYNSSLPYALASDSIIKGIALLEKIVRDNPQSSIAPEAMLEMARALLEVQVDFISGSPAEFGYPIIGDFHRAEKVLTEFLRRYPDHDLSREALLLLASVYESGKSGIHGRTQHGLERYDDALRTYEILRAKYPESEEAKKAMDRTERIRNRGTQ